MKKSAIQSKGGVSENPDTVTSHLLALLGADLFVKLQEKFGGEEIWFPCRRSLNDDHWLVVAMGWDDAKTIVTDFASILAYIPALPIDRHAGKAELIRSAAGEGKTRKEVAKHLGISERWLRELVVKLDLQGVFPLRPYSRSRRFYFHIEPSALKRCESVVATVRQKEMTRVQGARRLNVSATEFALMMNEHRKSGNLQALLKPTQLHPANSNGPLTGLAANSGTLPHSANENRVSGA
ncbi:helix-turn-helix domain-containing protein [Pararhizobium gei]|uniref:helix-turn-helix domain-containing protein n=1 Tax=Pararhizobium gei TaxID=1395951 RepID=UPI0023DA439B|nr:helix-turn-helix domain-containing protein [Rhizobium gei]